MCITDDFEKMVKCLADIEQFAPDDKLSTLTSASDELSEDELEFVAAAGVSDFEVFRRRYLTDEEGR